MKNIIVIFSLLALLCTASFDAHARKKFGSSKRGKTPATQQTAQKQKADTTTPTAAPKAKSNKKGIMAGVLGGLLAGGLIAAMLGDNFEGFQLLEMILLAGGLFILFKLVTGFLRANRAPQLASASTSAQQNAFKQAPIEQPTSTGFASSAPQGESVPFNLPPNFDVNGFLQGARSHYHTLQTAWNSADYTTMAEYLTPALVAEFKAEREAIQSVETEVMFIDAELVRADTNAQSWQVSVRFKGKYRDLGDKKEEPILEIWHLERLISDDAPWLIVGVEDLIDTQ
ncbi:Tim44 domain-containing protein [Pseudoalteromonas fuliginea]|uniref:Tim44 domain-containing protein n=1 Tax=Pseudoalteromonas fuliginea TaxID=1872678 RepID=A0ABQ6RGH6_9GAMM|nr:Tim44-like domain-containing protein [Pseudoalteromonas fuliginea]KAA1154114.1 Tim44 domain-containing protein [Pseudoalteromonas fuliginea]KAA1166732.1 Tim44 domain-containing protein [Pseudoalteromonas fuliginea]